MARKLGSKFEKFSNYDIRKLEELETLPTFRDYEDYHSDFSFLGEVNSRILAIVSGEENEAGVTLRMLEGLQEKEIEILYLQPERDFLSKRELQQELFVSCILQQYARSGCFHKIYLVSLSLMESFFENLPLGEYYDAVGGLVAGDYHIVNVLKNKKPLDERVQESVEWARIGTLGTMDWSTGELHPFFPLKNPVELMLYFGIPKGEIAETNLRKNILAKIKKNRIESLQISYKVFETEYERKQIWFEMSSGEIQT